MEEISCAMRYAAEGPYPEIKVQGKNRRYGQAMLSNVGGNISEMGAVASYLYGHFTQQGFPEVAESLEHISIVEVHHLGIFSELSRQLGEDPRLWTPFRGARRYWTPEYLRYPRRLEDFLRCALEDERAAIRKYNQQAGWIRDENIIANLRRIIADEEAHIQILSCFLESYFGTNQDLDLGLKIRATK